MVVRKSGLCLGFAIGDNKTCIFKELLSLERADSKMTFEEGLEARNDDSVVTSDADDADVGITENGEESIKKEVVKETGNEAEVGRGGG